MNLTNIMTNNFITITAKESISNISFTNTDGNDLVADPDFREMLKNQQFHSFMKELVDYSLGYYEKTIKPKVESILHSIKGTVMLMCAGF